MEHQDQDGYFNAFKGIMDRSLHEEVYSTISVRAHNNEYFFSKIPLLNMLDYARNNNIPVWTELMWLEFMQAKDSTSFHDVKWKNDHLTFEVRSSRAFERQLACLIPERFSDATVSTVTIDGQQTSHKLITIKGTRYARIFVTPGVNSIIDVAYKQ